MGVERLQQEALWTALYPWEEELARAVGSGRTRENRNKKDRLSYDPASLHMSNLAADIHSAAAEIGTCRLIGAYCYAGIWDVKDHKQYCELPDGMWKNTELEIKWRRSANKMPVDKKDAEKNRLVLWAESKLAVQYGCDCTYCVSRSKNPETTVRVLGGGYAGELWELGTTYNDDPNRVGVSAHLLTPIKEIITWERNLTLPTKESEIRLNTI